MHVCAYMTHKFLIITDLAIVTHTHLELIVDFDRKVLEGKAILHIEKKISSVNEIVSENFASC